MLNDDIDVLTGFPFIELRDFWSKDINAFMGKTRLM
jgi:hypothetical protein